MTEIDLERLGRALELVLSKAAPEIQRWDRIARVVWAAYQSEDGTLPTFGPEQSGDDA